MRSIMLRLCIALLVAASSWSQAVTFTFRNPMNGAQEVPPSATGGAGYVVTTYDTATGQFTWNANACCLSSGMSGAHYHGPAGPGVDAGIQVGIATNPLTGSATITTAQGAQLLAGLWYLNFHTSNFPGGEIRGQIQRSPADMNTDARPDLIWREIATGSTYSWFMNGTTLSSDQFMAIVDTTWKLVGTGDFNADGHTDVIWRNSESGVAFVWFLINGVMQSEAHLFTADPVWAVAGVADFNLDGKPDLLMRNTASGLAFAWYFNGTTAIGDQFLFSIDNNWKVENIGDFNRDARPDLLFRNMSSGLGFVWNTEYNIGSATLSLASSSAPMFTIDTAWEVVGVADWNLDGHVDLVFRNIGSGVVFVWYLTDTTLGASEFIIQIDPTWEIVPRR